MGITDLNQGGRSISCEARYEPTKPSRNKPLIVREISRRAGRHLAETLILIS